MPATQYQDLLVRSQPEVIQSAAAHKRALAHIECLLARRRRTSAENRLLELLSLLVNEYEERVYPTPDIAPGELLAHLLESRGITQAELAAQTGISKSTISAIVNGQREASKRVAQRLGEFFAVDVTALLVSNSN